jgi:RNA-directed DNA polymerase
MLTALEAGVRGGKWFSLMDKVYALTNLRAAFAEVKANGGAAGVDHQTVEMFEQHLEENVEKLCQSLQDGSYRPQAVRRVWISQAGQYGGTAFGDSDGSRPGGASGIAARVGTDL